MAEYIDRDDAIKGICKNCCGAVLDSCDSPCNDIDNLLSLPAADVAPVVHAHWIRCGDTPHFFVDECSECHTLTIDADAFCGACGAKMDEEDNDGQTT